MYQRGFVYTHELLYKWLRLVWTFLPWARHFRYLVLYDAMSSVYVAFNGYHRQIFIFTVCTGYLFLWARNVTETQHIIEQLHK